MDVKNLGTVEKINVGKNSYKDYLRIYMREAKRIRKENINKAKKTIAKIHKLRQRRGTDINIELDDYEA